MQILMEEPGNRGNTFVTVQLTQDEVASVDGYAATVVIIDRQQEQWDEYGTFFRERRYCFTLQELGTYISFDRPGAHEVHALLLRTPDTKEFRKDILARTGYGSYWLDLFFEDEDSPRSWGLGFGNRLLTHTKVFVTIEADQFAEPIPEWLRRWVTLLWRQPLKDECDLRARIPFAFLIQPFIVVWLLALRILLALIIGVFFGYRGVDWRSIIDFSGETMDVIRYTQSTWPYIDSQGNRSEREGVSSFYVYTSDGQRKPAYLRWIRPSILTPLVLVATRFSGSGLNTEQFWSTFWWVVLAIVVLGTVVELIALFIKIVVPILRTRNTTEQRALEAEAEEILPFAVELFVGGEIAVVREAAKRRSVWFRLYDLKGRVCRPFLQQR